MIKKYKKSLFIFRRDLRIQDNSGLYHAMNQSECVIPLFIFDPKQVGDDNPYKSTNAIQFMIESLQCLQEQIAHKGGRLQLCYGDPIVLLETLFSQEKSIEAIYVNRDYTPFSIERDKKIEQLCTQYSIHFHSYDDALLCRPENVHTLQNKPFRLFTPFFVSASRQKVTEVKKYAIQNFYADMIKIAHSDAIYEKILPITNPNVYCHGGSDNAQKILHTIVSFKQYLEIRDFPSHKTTALSAHLKFGTVSIRQVYHAIVNALGINHPLIRQLYWREFFTYVAFHNPRVFGHSYQEKYDHLPWSNNELQFKKWCNGMTGFPIVDAGMRQLNETGFMHNRVRMIAASFLVKDLHIDWRWGERYFAQKLVDYDPCVNNGNWQWVASTGCDSQPYFRIFNPWLQQKKFDSECEYIKQWIPELRHVDAKTIHAWEKKHAQNNIAYPAPMINHQKESAIAKNMYKKLQY